MIFFKVSNPRHVGLNVGLKHTTKNKSIIKQCLVYHIYSLNDGMSIKQ